MRDNLKVSCHSKNSKFLTMSYLTYRQLRARRALLQFKDVPLRRRALSLYKVNGDSALLVLNRKSLICNNALLSLNWRYLVSCEDIYHQCTNLQIPTDVSQMFHDKFQAFMILLFFVRFSSNFHSSVCILLFFSSKLTENWLGLDLNSL